jgi:hypothetical protein
MNWTYDEEMYERERAAQGRHVFPDWTAAAFASSLGAR